MQGLRRLTDEGLPFAGGARVAGELVVGEEAEFAQEGRLDLADVRAIPGEERALQERLHVCGVRVST